jgi:excisionase family DNA binding protein
MRYGPIRGDPAGFGHCGGPVPKRRCARFNRYVTTVTAPAQTREYLTVAEVALALGLSASTARRRIADGELPAHKLGTGRNSAVRVSRAELAKWLERQAVEVRRRV